MESKLLITRRLVCRDGLHFIAEVVGWLWLLTSQDTWRGSPGSTVSYIEAVILYFVFIVFFVDISFWCRGRWRGGGGKAGSKTLVGGERD